MATQGNDFFLKFGSDAAPFSEKLVSDLEPGIAALDELRKALLAYETQAANSKSGSSPLGLTFQGLDEAVARMERVTSDFTTKLGTQLDEMTRRVNLLRNAAEKIGQGATGAPRPTPTTGGAARPLAQETPAQRANRAAEEQRRNAEIAARLAAVNKPNATQVPPAAPTATEGVTTRETSELSKALGELNTQLKEIIATATGGAKKKKSGTTAGDEAHAISGDVTVINSTSNPVPVIVVGGEPHGRQPKTGDEKPTTTTARTATSQARVKDEVEAAAAVASGTSGSNTEPARRARRKPALDFLPGSDNFDLSTNPGTQVAFRALDQATQAKLVAARAALQDPRLNTPELRRSAVVEAAAAFNRDSQVVGRNATIFPAGAQSRATTFSGALGLPIAQYGPELRRILQGGREADAVRQQGGARIEPKGDEDKENPRAAIEASRRLKLADIEQMEASERLKAAYRSREVALNALQDAEAKELPLAAEIARAQNQLAAANERVAATSRADAAAANPSAYQRFSGRTNSNFGQDLRRHATSALENTIGYSLVFTGFEKLREIVHTGIEAQAAFVRLQASLDANGKSAGNLQADMAQISATTATPIEHVIEAASELAGTFKDAGTISFATNIASQLANISQGTLNAKEAAVGLRDVYAAYGDAWGSSDKDIQAGLKVTGDQIAHLSQLTGVSVKDITEGSTQIAQEAKDFGLNQRQASSIAAYITQATGQTGEQSASQLSRTMSSLYNSKTQTTLVKAGVATPEEFQNGQIGKILTSLISQYDHLSHSAQQSIAALMGTGIQARTFAALMNGGAAAAKAMNGQIDDTNALSKQNTAFLNTVAGSIKQLDEDFQNLGSSLQRMGAFDAIGLLAQSLDGLFKVANKAINGISSLFGDSGISQSLLHMIVILGEGAAAWKLFGGTAVRGLAAVGLLRGLTPTNAAAVAEEGARPRYGAQSFGSVARGVGSNVRGYRPGLGMVDAQGNPIQERPSFASRIGYNQMPFARGNRGAAVVPPIPPPPGAVAGVTPGSSALIPSGSRWPGGVPVVVPGEIPRPPSLPPGAGLANRLAAAPGRVPPVSGSSWASATGGARTSIIPSSSSWASATGGAAGTAESRAAASAASGLRRVGDAAASVSRATTEQTAATTSATFSLRRFGAGLASSVAGLTATLGLVGLIAVAYSAISSATEHANRQQEAQKSLLGGSVLGSDYALTTPRSGTSGYMDWLTGGSKSKVGAIGNIAKNFFEADADLVSNPLQYLGSVFGGGSPGAFSGHGQNYGQASDESNDKFFGLFDKVTGGFARGTAGAKASGGKGYKDVLGTLGSESAVEKYLKTQDDFIEKHRDKIERAGGNSKNGRAQIAYNINQLRANLESAGQARINAIQGFAAIDRLNSQQVDNLGSLLGTFGQFNNDTVRTQRSAIGALLAQSMLPNGSVAQQSLIDATSASHQEARDLNGSVGNRVLQANGIDISSRTVKTTQAFRQKALLRGYNEQIRTAQNAVNSADTGPNSISKSSKEYEKLQQDLVSALAARQQFQLSIITNALASAQGKGSLFASTGGTTAGNDARAIASLHTANSKLTDYNKTLDQTDPQYWTNMAAIQQNKAQIAALVAGPQIQRLQVLAAQTTDAVAQAEIQYKLAVAQFDKDTAGGASSDTIAADQANVDSRGIGKKQAAAAVEQAQLAVNAAGIRNDVGRGQAALNSALADEARYRVGGPLADQAQYLQAVAQEITTRTAIRDAIEAQTQSEYDVTAALQKFHGDDVAAAQTEKRKADQAYLYAVQEYGKNSAQANAAYAQSIQASQDAIASELARQNSALDLDIANLNARGQAGDDVKAARDEQRKAQNALNSYLSHGGKKGTATYNQLTGAVATARRQAFDTALQAQMDTLDFQQQTYQITSAQEVQALQQILKNKQLTLKEQREITLKIKNLQQSIRDQLTMGGMNIPSDIKLPTAYEVRRGLGAGYGGAGTSTQVTNNNQQVTVNNNVPNATVAAHIANQVIQLLNKQSGQQSRANTSTPRIVNTR